KKLGAKITVCGPKTLIPQNIDQLGVKVVNYLPDAIKGADVLNILRIQNERQKYGLLPSLREYSKEFGITKEKLAKFAKKDVLVMHPGPINRGIEMTSNVADGQYSVILNQVTNGLAVRMAVFYLIAQVGEN
ncbi:MAG: aspartate carbamoyltransferase, partial [Candidatus Omnitrophota bacterium]